MQPKLVSSALFSVALLASASSPFDVDVDSLSTREWDEDVFERGYDDWDEDVLERGYDDWDDVDARDFLYDDEDFAGLDARSDEILDLDDFTTRELVDELSDRLEARAVKSFAAGAAKTFEKSKTPAAGAPGLKTKPASGGPNLREATKEDWDKLLQEVQKLKAKQRSGATGGSPLSTSGGKGGKSTLKAKPGKTGGSKAKSDTVGVAQSGSKGKVKTAAPPSAA